MNETIQQVHLGLGQFFRAHQAYYTQISPEVWNIAAVSMRTDSAVKQMQEQNNTYSIMAQDFEGHEVTEIDCVKECYFLPQSYEQVLSYMSSEQIEIVSLTITEKGYCYDFKIGCLDLSHSDIKHDLTAEKCKSAIGLIAQAIENRFNTHKKTLTLLSCDNVSFNGDILKKAISEFLRARKSPALDWFVSNIESPNTMVDRIVPKTTEKEKSSAAKLANIENDPLLILTEKFSQWCIEDRFSSERPKWPGAQFVKNIEPFENLKLRALNASHSYLTYLGRLKNYDTVDQAIEDKEILEDIQSLYHNEVYPTLQPDISAQEFRSYTTALIIRFKNPHLKHRLEQIAMDGSQKVPQRWLPVLKENPESCPVLEKAIAVWILFLWRKTKKNEEIHDPLAEKIKDWSKQSLGEFISHFSEIVPIDILSSDKFKKVIDEQNRRFF